MSKRILTGLVVLALVGLLCYTVFPKVYAINNDEQISETEITFVESEIATAEIIETVPAETEPEETKAPYVEKYKEVPLYNQLDYAKTRYGNSTVKESGCGIVSYAMVLTYLLDREILPDELASMYRKYKVKEGSSHNLFTDTADDWGVSVVEYYWEEAWIEGKVMEALENGQPIIVSVKADSAFTDGGHIIVFYGLSQDGKILVRDPNGENYLGEGFLVDGFKNGFEPDYFRGISGKYFVYNAKDLDALAEQAE